MQSDFYNFADDPFSETPNTRFYFSSITHQATIGELTQLIDSGAGFISITGEVGTGKSLIARYMINKYQKSASVAYLYWPILESKQLIGEINKEYKIPKSDDGFYMLERLLLANAEDGKKTLLFIDEAQGLSTSALETIRLISNLECETKKLIQIILLGQPELNEMLLKPELRQVNQRISRHLKLSSLSFREVEMYIKHRIEIAKGSNLVKFDYRSIKEIYNFSKGIPRLINLICRTALLYGQRDQSRIITAKIVKQTLNDCMIYPKRKKGLFKEISFFK